MTSNQSPDTGTNIKHYLVSAAYPWGPVPIADAATIAHRPRPKANGLAIVTPTLCFAQRPRTPSGSRPDDQFLISHVPWLSAKLSACFNKGVLHCFVSSIAALMPLRSSYSLCQLSTPLSSRVLNSSSPSGVEAIVKKKKNYLAKTGGCLSANNGNSAIYVYIMLRNADLAIDSIS